MVAADAAVHRAGRAGGRAPLDRRVPPLRPRGAAAPRAPFASCSERFGHRRSPTSGSRCGCAATRELTEALDEWFTAEPTKPEDVPAADWLRWEQNKHENLLGDLPEAPVRAAAVEVPTGAYPILTFVDPEEPE